MNINTTDLTWHQLITSTNLTLQLELLLFLVLSAIAFGSVLYIVKQSLECIPLNDEIKFFMTYVIIIFISLITLTFITIVLYFLLTFKGIIVSMALVGIALLLLYKQLG